MSYLPPKENFPKARAAAMKALQIDGALAEGHSALGLVKWGYEWDWSGAEREFKRAIELNPNSAAAHGGYADYFLTIGRFEESLVEARRAQELDLLSPAITGDLGWHYLAARRYDESIAQMDKAIELDRNLPWLYAVLGWAYARKGMYSHAIAEYDRMGVRAYAISPENQVVASGLAWIYALAGRRSDAIKMIERFNKLASEAYVDFYCVAIIYAGLGDKDRVFEFLDKAYEEHSAGMPFLKADPFWDNLRSDPRFEDLLRRMGLPQTSPP